MFALSNCRAEQAGRDAVPHPDVAGGMARCMLAGVWGVQISILSLVKQISQPAALPDTRPKHEVVCRMRTGFPGIYANLVFRVWYVVFVIWYCVLHIAYWATRNTQHATRNTQH